MEEYPNIVNSDEFSTLNARDRYQIKPRRKQELYWCNEIRVTKIVACDMMKVPLEDFEKLNLKRSDV